MNLIMWLRIIGAAIALVGTILIFDTRRIIKKNFPTSNENEAVLGARILGTIIAFVGGIICMIN